VRRLEQTLNKPILVLVVGVIAVALNVVIYFGYQMSETPLIGHMYSIGASLPGDIGKSEPKARSDSQPASESDAEAGGRSGPEESLEADSASFFGPSPVSVPPQTSASAQATATAQPTASPRATSTARATVSAQASTGPPPPQRQSVTNSSSEESISQDASVEGSRNIDPSSSCPYSKEALKDVGLECTKVTVPVPMSTSP
jgi:hypothetical protein